MCTQLFLNPLMWHAVVVFFYVNMIINVYTHRFDLCIDKGSQAMVLMHFYRLNQIAACVIVGIASSPYCSSRQVTLLFHDLIALNYKGLVTQTRHDPTLYNLYTDLSFGFIFGFIRSSGYDSDIKVLC